jgi:hypothetical protein
VTEDKHLTQPAANLARAAPHQWDEFKKAFRDYENGVRDSLVKAPAGDLAKIQGSAQLCSALAALFDDAIAASDRMVQRQMAGMKK